MTALCQIFPIQWIKTLYLIINLDKKHKLQAGWLEFHSWQRQERGELSVCCRIQTSSGAYPMGTGETFPMSKVVARA
jgi:hypothetical protein